MASFLALRFPGLTVDDYHAINEKLGIDVATGSGDWPEGLLSHAAGIGDDGAAMVAEVWSSREAQDRFMQDRLAPAMAAAGVSVAPSSVEWTDLEAYVTST
jgi:hypothetical protein